ncbi:MAG: beta-glucosidase [Streptosporangiaceae bacterium]|nr:beta-glucosidase [Streptosporangiaceae bacterium]MBV9854380.1 beta-glucosidase [Streptosporangiaceae bacterium]
MTTLASSTDGALPFPPGFVWGAATAAYQIEGAARADGRGPSVWDTFSHTPGKVRGGDTGDIACDSYHRYQEDVALMASLGLNAYRFSVSWPRVQPGGRGAVNSRGLDYYRALLDQLADRGIAPAVTLYHWDLPQELQDEGGWAARDTAYRFAEFAEITGAALGDRVARWITLNEPQVVANNGYRTGDHAPGLRDAAAAAAATHHLLLGHGLAVQALRAGLPAGTPAGVTLDMHPVRVVGDGRADLVERARLITDANLNGLFLEPLLHGRYPAHAEAELLPPESLIADGDLEAVSQPLDFLGVNYYSPVYLRAGDPRDLRANEHAIRGGVPGVVGYSPESLERTPMGWLVDPDGLYELLVRLSKDAPGLPLYVTENGCAAEDYVNPEGAVNDVERVRYLHLHLDAAARAIRDGASLAGYFVWSLLDNFEWGWGYQKRFGIVFVDFGTQRRTPKSSARFYSDVIRANAVPARGDGAPEPAATR